MWTWMDECLERGEGERKKINDRLVIDSLTRRVTRANIGQGPPPPAKAFDTMSRLAFSVWHLCGESDILSRPLVAGSPAGIERTCRPVKVRRLGQEGILAVRTCTSTLSVCNVQTRVVPAGRLSNELGRGSVPYVILSKRNVSKGFVEIGLQRIRKAGVFKVLSQRGARGASAAINARSRG